MSEERGFSAGSIALAFVVGGIVGAGVALLTAPQSGRETREKIKDLADEAKEKIVSVAEDAKEKMLETYSRGKDMVGEKKTVIASAIEAGKKAMEDERLRIASK